jgi:hypothetical protein
MMTSNELARVYETLLCIPGMNDQVKLDLKISRKQVLVLTQVIERGLKEELEKPTGILIVAKDADREIKETMRDCLEKAGLTELSNKLQSLDNR